MNLLILLSVSLMILFAILKRKFFGILAWISFSFAWIFKIPYYLSVSDYFNTALMIVAFLLFNLIGFTIAKTSRVDVFANLTSLSALAALAYFPFALDETMKNMLIYTVVKHTVLLGNFLGYPISHLNNMLVLNGKAVEIILACTGIESMALFFGVSLSVKADLERNLGAFLVSVPTIYFLNLLRNVFVTVSYAYSWFGENSFFIAHHVISKILATLALVLISLIVFKILPELFDLLSNVKDEILNCWVVK